MKTQQVYFDLLPNSTPTADENYELARSKKQAAQEFVQAFLGEDECFERLVESWRERQRQGASMAPMAEEYGDSAASASELAERVNQGFEQALENPANRIAILTEAGVAFQHYVDLFQNSPLSISVRERLAPRHQKYLAIRNELILTNLKLVPGFVKSYLNRGIEFLDLLQHGNLGLMRAIDKFDPDRDTRISTYANWWVRRYLSDLIKDTKRTVRVPRHVPAVVEKMSKFQRKFVSEHGVPPTTEDVREEFPALTEWKQFLLETSMLEILPLDLLLTSNSEEPIDPRSYPLYSEIDLLPHEHDAVEEIETQAEVAEIVRKMADVLSHLEQLVIKMRFGLEQYRPSTLKEIGDHLGLNMTAVKNLEQTALVKLRRMSGVEDG